MKAVELLGGPSQSKHCIPLLFSLLSSCAVKTGKSGARMMVGVEDPVLQPLENS